MNDFTALESQLKKNVQGEVRFDAYSRILYSTDASIFQIEPIGVVIPRNRQDVIAAVSLAAENNVPILPRGAGTSLAGQAIAHALVLDFSKYMNRVLAVDSVSRRVRVEPGVVLDELNRELRPAGLFFPPDPATASRCNIGGMIGNNSSGSRSIVYGKTIDYVERLQVLLSSGEQLETCALTPLELNAKRQGQDRESGVYRESIRIAEENREEIARRYPKILRRVGGYNLDSLLATDGLNLGHVITGSEGTLGIVLEAEIRLVPRPKTTAVMVAHFRELSEALEATQVVLETGPSAVELIDKIVIDLTRATQEYSRRMTFVEGDPSALLLIEYSGETTAELASKLDAAESKLRAKGMGFAFIRALDAAAQANIWKVRNAGQGLLLGMVGDRKPATFVEDTAVSPEKLPEYIRRFQQIVRDHGTEACFYAHASVGCLHIRPLIDLKQAPEREKLRSIAEAVSDLVLEFGGALSGEHGDGLVRSPFNEKMFGSKLYGAFRELKRVFDPKGLLNPGKIVEALPLGEAMSAILRIKSSSVQDAEKSGDKAFSSSLPTVSVPFDLGTTRLDFSKQGGFARAIEMCSGVGACRKRGEGTMCPSYMATNEEEHSTRGRAVLLQAAISGRLPSEELVSERMHQALDLCLECKGCKGECPANVDMAKLKYEFLARYHDKHGVPLRTKLFGNVAAINKRASKTPKLYNWSLRNGLVRSAMESFGGIDRRRALPLLADERYSTWFAHHKEKRQSNSTPNAASTRQAVEGLSIGTSVALFVDTFTEYNHPSVGIAATKVLEAMGYEVKPIIGRCCGRPLISKGLLDQAAENARANVDLFRDITDRRMPIVGLEPSCLLSFRDEYPALLPGADAKRVAQNCFLLEELFTPERQHPNPNPIFQPIPRHALFHGHCHLKALVGSEPSLRMLRTIPDLKVDEIDSGCCGMAGSFGYEKEHYDISIQIAERKLAPAVRSLPAEDLVIAGGVSCRQQVADRTGRQALHPAEVMAMAIGESS